MKPSRSLLAVACTCAFALLAQGQASHIHKEYLKDSKSTKVETPLLYLTNAPEQFVEFQLSAVYKGERQTRPANPINLTLFSLAKTAQYGNRETLYAITDGTRWPVGTASVLDMKGETKKGADAFYGSANPNVGMQVPFPPAAQVRNGGGDVTGLHMEWLNIVLKPEQLGKLAAAQKVSLQLKDKPFELNETHLSILRDFVAQITPQP